MATSAERQAAFKAAQRAKGLKQVTQWMTDDEQFYVERLIQHMRNNPGDVPAMMRRANGTLAHLDT